MYDKVVDILLDFTPVKREEITGDSDLIDDLGLDSVSYFGIMFRFEETFGVEIPEDEIRELRTVGDIMDLLKRLPSDA